MKNTDKNTKKLKKTEKNMKKQEKNKNIKNKTLKQKQEQMLRIWYTNADTLTQDKIRELENEITSDMQPDIIAITEFKPKNYIRELTQHDFKLDNYIFECENLTSKTSTRGVAFYIHKSIKYKRLKTSEVIGQEIRYPKEMLTLDISLNDKENYGLQITNIYRSPNNTKEDDETINETFRAFGNTKNTLQRLVVGDFNRKGIDWRSMSSSCPSDNKFIEAIRDSYLLQQVEVPTRGRGENIPSLLDLIFTSNEQNIGQIKMSPPLGKSDHNIIKVLYRCHPDQVPDKVIPNPRKADYETMRKKLDINWENYFSQCNKNVDNMWKSFIELYNKVEFECVPRKTIKMRKRNGTYNLDRKTLAVRKKKYRLWKRYMESNDTKVFEEYARARNQLRRETRKATKSLEKEIAKSSRQNAKSFWAYVNRKTKYKNSTPELYKVKSKDCNNMTTSDSQKADELGKYFSSVFVIEPDWNWDLHRNEESKKELKVINIKKEIIIKKLKNLDSNKSPGLDNLHPMIFKELAEVLAEPLFIIFTTSLVTGKLPQEWKMAKITAIYKNKGDKHSAENYRPISLTSIACKIMESIIRDDIMKYLSENNILTNRQFGFMGGRSTTTQLLQIMDKWTEVLENDGTLDVIFCDFKKAFDTVPHRRLIDVLQYYGINEPVISWIQNFLNDRQQKVCVNGTYSQVFDVTSGVPQGSVLGPLLFLIYINVMVEKTENAEIYLYADDLKLYQQINNDSDAENLQNDVDKLYDWTTYSLLKFHPDKCETMRIKPNRKKDLNNPYYCIDNTRLRVVTIVEDLGITFDNKLSFDDHICKKVSKANSLVGMIRRTFVYLDKDMFKKLFTAIVRPHLEYGATVWNPSKKTQIDKIERVQRRATKLIPGLSSLTYKERLLALNMPTLQYRRYRGDMIELYKISHNFYDPATINGFINFTSDSNSRYCLRRHEFSFYKEKCSKDVRKNSFKIRTANQWNNLPASVVNAATLNSFKNNLDRIWRKNDVMFDSECDLVYVTSSRQTRYEDR